MAKKNIRRNQLIQRAIAKGNGEIEDITIMLWQPLASQLISLMGEGGFSSLYSRSLYLTNMTYPWLSPGDAPQFAKSRFADLKTNLEKQSADDATKGSCALFITFTDILASLIGEQLTMDILRSAWSDDASDADMATQGVST